MMRLTTDFELPLKWMVSVCPAMDWQFVWDMALCWDDLKLYDKSELNITSPIRVTKIYSGGTAVIWTR